MTTHAATVEAQLSPGVTSRAPHGSNGPRLAPRRVDDDMTPLGIPGRKAALRCRGTQATNGTGFTRGPSPRNPLPIVHV